MEIIGIGTDITEVLRIAKMIEQHGELFINRVYTTREIAHCSSRRYATQNYAGRWAAKEAILKALGTGWRKGISWRDVEVVPQRVGPPTVELHGGALEVARRRGIDQVMISISHCRSHATAYCIAVGRAAAAANDDDE